MQAALQKKTEVKVYILYVLKNIAFPVDYNTFHDTVTADEPVTAFAFTECFSELLDTENIEIVETDDGKDEFMITQKGINVCDSLLYLLIPSVQKTALHAASRLMSFEKSGMNVSVNITQKNEDFLLCFSVNEKDKPILYMETNLKNEEQAKDIAQNIKTNPEFIYKKILLALES
ncbi:MAG: DUF4364 family protein [Clostridia bacterium]|nr:DUF4364 family protein [Clostridia bacterium]